jgi:hypothetical protein
MEAGPSLARPARARHRHELRMLTYVTLDQANGGIVRNLTHDGIAVQAVAAVRPRQQLRVRFELRYPRLRVEMRGEVVWSTFSGRCGIRFIDPPATLVRQIDEWIFGDLLQGLAIPTEPAGFLTPMPAPVEPAPIVSPQPQASGITARVLQEFEKEGSRGGPASHVESSETESEEDGGLIVSAAKMKVIELRPPNEPLFEKLTNAKPTASTIAAPVMATATQAPDSAIPAPARVELDWLSQPLSGRGLAWTVDVLVVTAAVLLFALVFLSITREAPKWPYAMSAAGAIVIGGLYWGFFKLFGGTSLGERLARLSEMESFEDEDADARFR